MRRLKERIVFVSAETAEDLSGGFEKISDQTLYECWANIEQSSSNKAYQNFQLANMVIVSVTMRTNPIFTPSLGQNIKWKDRFLTIQGEPDISETQFIEFQAAYDPKVKVNG